ncbi:MAG: MFS transporter [Chloroflexi bacterium]|nr:MFS transporter [Chloroflexota bacterium]
MPLIYPLVLSEFHLSYSQIGLMVGVASAAGGLLQMSFSYLSRLVPRRVLLGGGQIIMALSAAATAFAGSFGLFFLGNLAARIGTSPQHPVGNSILSDQFQANRRGFALSAHVSGGNVGTVLVPLVGTYLIATYDWRATLLIFGGIAALVGLCLIFLTNETRKQAEAPAVQSQGSLRDIRSILSDRTVLFIFLASTIAAGGRGLGVLITYVPLYLQNALKMDPTVSGVLFTVLLVGSVAGPLVFGRLSDRRGRRAILFLIYGVSTLLTVAFTAVGASWLLPFVLLAMGIFIYAESPLLQTFLADATQHLDRDLAFGLYFTVAFGVGAIWALILGWLIDSFGFDAGFYVMAASYAVAGLLLVPTRDVTQR